MWGFDGKNHIEIDQGDMLLIFGARVTQKYGSPQLNVNSSEGSIIVNPSSQLYKLPVFESAQAEVPSKAAKPVVSIIGDLSNDSKDKLGITELEAQVIRIITPCKDMTYAGCPKCYAKTGEAVTIMKQTTCSNPRCEKTVVPLTYFYFFRCIIQDNSGQIEVGFARDFAQNLLNGIEPVKFRQMFSVYNSTYQVQFTEYCS